MKPLIILVLFAGTAVCQCGPNGMLVLNAVTGALDCMVRVGTSAGNVVALDSGAHIPATLIKGLLGSTAGQVAYQTAVNTTGFSADLTFDGAGGFGVGRSGLTNGTVTMRNTDGGYVQLGMTPGGGFYSLNFPADANTIGWLKNPSSGGGNMTITSVTQMKSDLGIASLVPVTLTDGASVAWSLGGFNGGNGVLTLVHTTATRALNVSNLISGGSYALILKQDGTGGAALTLGTGCTWKVSGGGAGAVSLSAGANAIDTLAVLYDGTNCYAVLTKNFN